MKKYIVYVDMDGVIADFDSQIVDKSTIQKDPKEMYRKGFFRKLPVFKGAKKGISWLLKQKNLEVFVATKPLTENLYSTIEKYQWIEEHFPKLLKKMFLTCDKTKLIGDFLIDDFEKWRGFKGTFVHFKGDWNKTIEEIKSKI